MSRSSISFRHSQSSPSVTIEKGRYILHAPGTMPPPPKFPKPGTPRRAIAPQSQYDRRIALLLVLLVVASAVSFGSAYYLFKTRWDSPALNPQGFSSDAGVLAPQVVDFEPDLDRKTGAGTTAVDSDLEDRVSMGGTDATTKYLAYLPHSGFHNQRIALENALVLARILNRTLLVPPVRLGKAVLQYKSFDNLKHLLALSSKEGLRYCANVGNWSTLPVECGEYFDYTLMSWDWLMDLTPIRDEQPLISRWDMRDDWLERALYVLKNDTFYVKDSNPYHYRFIDTDLLDDIGSRYMETASISLLSQVPQRLLHLGTLFGSSRLRLRSIRNIDTRTHIRKNMVLANPILLNAAYSIREYLGGDYLGAHVRIGDGHFSEAGEENVRLIWWKLVHVVLGLSVDQALRLEAQATGKTGEGPPDIHFDFAAARVPHTPLPLFDPHIPQVRCRGRLHASEGHLTLLNAPLFISTDVPNAASQPLLRIFYKTFPCTFTLSDLGKDVAQALAPINRLQNGYDGLMLREFVFPLLDAIVAGRAHAVVGTKSSTFSQFVEDVLWRQYHGFDIVQRG